MTNPQGSPADLPSAAKLMRATLIAVVVAVVILITAVLPAEYGVDPTGVGRLLGLTQMGEIKMSLAREAEADAAADAAAQEEAEQAATEAAAPSPTAEAAAATAAAPTDSAWRDVTIVTLMPGEGKEVKLVMAKNAQSDFRWNAVGGVVNHDTHGDSTGAPKSYINYRKGTGVTADSGVLTAAMDGAHGWFWRNRGTAPVSVTLRTRGAYSELKKMY